MKKGLKFKVVFMLVLSMLISMTGAAFAATTTGMKDDFYSAQTNPDASNLYYKVVALIEGGKISSFSFEYHGSRLITADLVQYMPEDRQAGIKALIEEQAYYNDLINNGGDPANVSKYSKSTNNDVYSTLQSLWKEIVVQAGGKIAAETSAPESSSSNPKTGDSGVLVYAFLAGAALVLTGVLRKKKFTA